MTMDPGPPAAGDSGGRLQDRRMVEVPMTELLLGEREQTAVRAVIASEPVPGVALPGAGVLQHLSHLIDCDAIGIALLDGTGVAVGEAALRGDRTGGRWGHDGLPPAVGPVTLGIRQRHRAPGPDGSPGARGVAVLSLGVRNGPDHVVTLWMVRRTRDFSDRDRTMLGLLAPALERLMRERPSSTLPSLTVQERRVLQHVAAGLSNAEIAERLFVAPCTVRKHLENAYRKLGVTNRLAAVNALDGALGPDPDRVAVLV